MDIQKEISRSIDLKIRSLTSKIENGEHVNWIELPSTEWVMRLMESLHALSRNCANYKEFQEGLIELAAISKMMIVATLQLEAHEHRISKRENKTNGS